MCIISQSNFKKNQTKDDILYVNSSVSSPFLGTLASLQTSYHNHCQPLHNEQPNQFSINMILEN